MVVGASPETFALMTTNELEQPGTDCEQALLRPTKCRELQGHLVGVSLSTPSFRWSGRRPAAVHAPPAWVASEEDSSR